MNKKQKWLTIITVIVLAIWAFNLNEDMGQAEKYRPPVTGYLGGLAFIVIGYAGLFFVMKK